MFVSIGFGSMNLPLSEVKNVLLEKILHTTHEDLNDLSRNIVWNLRLPRILSGYLVGVALALAGVTMQSLFQNSIADPFVLGVASGASFFATLCLIFGLFAGFGIYALPISAFIGAMLSLIIVFCISLIKKQIRIVELLLIGIIVSMIFDAGTRFIVLSAPNALGVHNTEFWMSGSLINSKWELLKLPFISITCFSIILFFHHRSLDLLSLGEEQAMALGLHLKRTRIILIIVTTVLTGVTIALGGVIGFVGMICPHFARKLVGGRHLYLIPTAGMLGGICTVVADVIARVVIAPVELPLGLITAVIGGPVFLGVYLLKGRESL